MQIVLDSRCVGYLLPARRTVCESIVFHDNNSSVIFCQLHNGGVPVGQIVQYTAALTFSVLEVGRFGTACHTGTSSFCLKNTATSCLINTMPYGQCGPQCMQMQRRINRVRDNYAHKKTVSQSREERFSVELAATLRGSRPGVQSA